MRYAKYHDKVHQSFDQQSLMRTFGAQIETLEPGLCTITAPILDGHLQQQGYAHAGLTFSVADSAAGYAALSLMQEDAEVLTVEMKINLIAPATGETLIAKGRVIKSGRRLIIVGAEVFARANGKDTMVALLQGTMIPTT
jgi:uncharacterized protein (TIGR00369 family)